MAERLVNGHIYERGLDLRVEIKMLKRRQAFGFLTAAPFALLLLSVLVCQKGASAATATDYHQRIREAVSALERLKLTYDGEDSSQRARRTTSTIEHVRKRLPS